MRHWWIRWMSCALVALAMSVGVMGCEDSDDTPDRIYFKNESQQVVTFITSHSVDEDYPFPPSTHVLQPGGEYSSPHIEGSTLYYDWEPKDTVEADEVSGNEVVFKDRD